MKKLYAFAAATALTFGTMGAAQAAESLDELERRQAEMNKETEQWREGLKTVESKMGQGETAMKSNIEVVEPWVRDLEKRLDRLESTT